MKCETCKKARASLLENGHHYCLECSVKQKSKAVRKILIGMSKRFCDGCKCEIPQSSDFIRCILVKHLEKSQSFLYQGDLCLACWKVTQECGII